MYNARMNNSDAEDGKSVIDRCWAIFVSLKIHYSSMIMDSVNTKQQQCKKVIELIFLNRATLWSHKPMFNWYEADYTDPVQFKKHSKAKQIKQNVTLNKLLGTTFDCCDANGSVQIAIRYVSACSHLGCAVTREPTLIVAWYQRDKLTVITFKTKLWK